MMKLFFASMVIYLICNNSINAQTNNMIKNGGFENYNQLPPPNGHSKFDGYLKDWTSRTFLAESQGFGSGGFLHSPDFYWHDGIGSNRFFADSEIKPYKGNGQVGVYDYELFQQQLSVFPVRHRMYSISFNYLNASHGNDYQPLTTNSNSRINIYLAKKEVKYIEEKDVWSRVDCTYEYRNWRTSLGQKFFKIGSVSLSNAQYNEWMLYEGAFFVPDNNFKYLVVEVVYDDHDYINGFQCSRSYVLFDEFRMERFCNHACAPEFDNVLAHYTDGNDEDVFFSGDDILMNNHINDNSFSLVNFKDVNYVKIVTTGRGGDMEERIYFDPEGLSNDKWLINPSNQNTPTYQFINNRSDLFSVLWNGRVNGNIHGETSVLTVRIIAMNCSDYYDKTFLVTVQGNMSVSEPIYNSDNTLSCCTPGNLTLSTPTSGKYTVEGFIEMQNGFTFDNLNDYQAYAGEYLLLSDESSIEPVDNKFATLSILNNCKVETSSDEIITISNTTNTIDSISFENITHNESSVLNINVFPNPASNEITISILDEYVEATYIVTTINGIVVKEAVFYDSTTHIDVSDLPNGIYLVQVQCDYAFSAPKKVIVHN